VPPDPLFLATAIEAVLEAGRIQLASFGRSDLRIDKKGAIDLVTEVDVALGIPPKISASVTAAADMTAEHVEAVLAEHAEKKFTVVLVKALFQAWKLQNSIHIVGMKPRNMGVELGLIPAITIKFVPS
jgi:hypothetical protein